MSMPLLPLGGAALGTFAWSALRELPPGQFLRELWSGGQQPETAEAGGRHPATNSVVRGPADEQAASSLARLVRSLTERFRAAGIGLAEPVVLREDGFGGVVVDGAHPEREAIERVLARDASLQADFLAVAAAATCERGASTDPAASSFEEFRLRLNGHEASIYFE